MAFSVHSPVLVTSKGKAEEEVVGRTVGVGHPLAQLRRDAVVHTFQNLAVLVPVTLAVPSVLVSVAVALRAQNLAFDRRNSNVEIVVAA